MPAHIRCVQRPEDLEDVNKSVGHPHAQASPGLHSLSSPLSIVSKTHVVTSDCPLRCIFFFTLNLLPGNRVFFIPFRNVIIGLGCAGVIPAMPGIPGPQIYRAPSSPPGSRPTSDGSSPQTATSRSSQPLVSAALLPLVPAVSVVASDATIFGRYSSHTTPQRTHKLEFDTLSRLTILLHFRRNMRTDHQGPGMYPPFSRSSTFSPSLELQSFIVH